MNQSLFAGGGLPVGAQAAFTDLGPLMTLGDGSTWARSGVALDRAAYPELAALPQYDIIGKAATTLATMAAPMSGFCDNGAGVMLLCLNDGAYRSTDGGETWVKLIGTPASHLMIAPVWTGSAFVALFRRNDLKTRIFTSPDGVMWTAGAVAGYPNGDDGMFGGALANEHQVMGVWTGERCVFVHPTSANSALVYMHTTDGAVVSGGLVPSVGGGGSTCLVTDGAGKVAICGPGYNGAAYSVNHGQNFSGLALPGPPSPPAGVAFSGGVLLVHTLSGGRPSTLIAIADPSNAAGTTTIHPSPSTGATKLIQLGGKAYFDNNTSIEEIASDCKSIKPLGILLGTSKKLPSGNSLVMFGTADPFRLAVSAASVRTYSGISGFTRPITPNNASVNTSLVTYVRAK